MKLTNRKSKTRLGKNIKMKEKDRFNSATSNKTKITKNVKIYEVKQNLFILYIMVLQSLCKKNNC